MNGKDLRTESAAAVVVQGNGDIVMPEPSEEFVCTPYVQEVTERALLYLEAGYPVHFAGPAGTGKTTLAFHVAARLGRPVSLLHGDHEFGSSDLIGRDAGYRKYKLIDNFIHSVLKTEEEMKSIWVDNRLTTACENGNTLIYDEFTRSRPEANNALLTILSEKILNLPSSRRYGESYLRVHPDFHAIFTSNPEEYAGVHKTQDALMDRLITINLGHCDRETEIQITMAKSGILRKDAEATVDVVRKLRGAGVNNSRKNGAPGAGRSNERHPTIRACIAIARILALRGARARWNDPVFRWACRDVLNTDSAKVTRAGQSLIPQKVDEVIQNICGPRNKPAGNTVQTTDDGKGAKYGHSH